MATLPKYQPRPQMRLSDEASRHVAPASSDRYSPPAFASTMANRRLRFVGATAIPIRPTPSVGKPLVSCCQFDPPSVDRSEEHTSELQSRPHLVCRLLLEKKKTT